MPLQTINAYRLSPSGAWELTGLHERRTFYGYTLREAKRVYRLEYRQKFLGEKDAYFYTRSGLLTAYAFACGYVERHGENGEIRIYLDGVYHVQNGSVWESFATLTEARRFARRLSKGAK